MVKPVAEAPRIRFERGELWIEFEPLFGPGREEQARRFARRVFGFPEVSFLSFSPEASRARLRFEAPETGRREFLARLAAALRDEGPALAGDRLPVWQGAAELRRFEDLVTLLDVTRAGAGRLRLRHGAFRDGGLGRRLEGFLGALDGVAEAVAVPEKGVLSVAYRPEATDAAALIRAAEAPLAAPATALATEPPAAPLGWANATLGLAAVGELAVPAVLPVCIAMLLYNNVGTVRDAGRQLGRGRIGLPFLHTALLGCSITTGQIVAHALMEWSFRFWERRSRGVLAEECRTLLGEQLPVPAEARLVRSDRVEALVPADTVQPGQSLRIEGPGPLAVDGRVTAGIALVQDAFTGGLAGAVRKSRGDEVLAGSTVLAGTIEIEVLRTGLATRAAAVARQLVATADRLHQDPLVRDKALALADRPVIPTLATAGVGYAVGSLFTVGAILHQDYLSGPALAAPLEAFRDIGLAFRCGILIQSGSALVRLGESRFVVLDDHPAWAECGLELERLESRLAAAETDKLLGYVAGAGLYLGDDRSEALTSACRDRGLVVRRPPLVGLGAGQVTVRQGGHTLVLADEADSEAEVPASLRVEIDGNAVAWVRFRPGSRPRAAEAVERLRRNGIPVFLLSARPAAEVEALAKALGTEHHGGDFTPEQKLRFLESLARRGVRATYVGPATVVLGAAAHVAVALGEGAGSDPAADAVLASGRLDGLPEVMERAAGYEGRVRDISRKALLPNLLCIAGAFGGVLNGTTAGLIANGAVYRAYREARGRFGESRNAHG